MTAMTAPDLPVPAVVPLERTVVAVVLEWRGRVALLRRSAGVRHDRGRWHCVTGYVEAGSTPTQQAWRELHEETGLGVTELEAFDTGLVIGLVDESGLDWRVHTFRAVTTQRRLRLDDEHDSYRWVRPVAVRGYENRVAWLDDVLVAAPPRR